MAEAGGEGRRQTLVEAGEAGRRLPVGRPSIDKGAYKQPAGAFGIRAHPSAQELQALMALLIHRLTHLLVNTARHHFDLNLSARRHPFLLFVRDLGKGSYFYCCLLPLLDPSTTCSCKPSAIRKWTVPHSRRPRPRSRRKSWGSGGRRLILRNLAGDEGPGRAGVSNCQRNVDGRSWKKLHVENFA